MKGFAQRTDFHATGVYEIYQKKTQKNVVPGGGGGGLAQCPIPDPHMYTRISIQDSNHNGSFCVHNHHGHNIVHVVRPAQEDDFQYLG